MRLISFLLVVSISCSAANVAQQITPAQAKDHVGKQATVCGIVASANFAQRSRRQPTFLNLDKPYPNHIFTAVIWGDDRAKFGQPEVELKGKRVCVSGVIENYKGTPEIILREKAQLEIK